MTTAASPDGQQPTTPGEPGATPPAGEPIRNMDDARKAFATRDEFKESTRALETMITALAEKLDKLATPAAPAAGAAAPAASNGIEDQLKQLAGVVQGIVSKDDAKAKADRRKALTDAVAGAARDDASREIVRGALATMAIDGEIDLFAADTAAEADKALTRLRASKPGLFAPNGNGAPAASGAHDAIPPGMKLHQLTEEQLARITDEDFKKLDQQSRTSGLVY